MKIKKQNWDIKEAHKLTDDWIKLFESHFIANLKAEMLREEKNTQ